MFHRLLVLSSLSTIRLSLFWYHSCHSFYFPCGRAVSSWRIIHKRLSMSTSLVTFALLPVTTASAAIVGISHSMALSVALLVELHGAYGDMATAAGKNLYRQNHIEGHCNDVHKEKVWVGFWVGNCNNSQGAYVAERFSVGFLWWFQATSVEVLRET